MLIHMPVNTILVSGHQPSVLSGFACALHALFSCASPLESVLEESLIIGVTALMEFVVFV